MRSEYRSGFRIDRIEEPSPDSSVGGDVLLFGDGTDGGLRFLIADMAGSGRRGHEVWQSIEVGALRAWTALIASECSPADLRLFGEAVNREAVAADTSLCLAAGRVDEERIDWATWGYGVHVLPSSMGEVPLLPAHDQAFGLKLGWLSDTHFRGIAGSFVLRSLENPTRVMLFTDGLLGEDHAAPEQTWDWLEETNRIGASTENRSALSWLIERSDIRADDVTAVVLTAQPLDAT